MKKVIFIFVSVVVVTALYGQPAVKFGIKAGSTFSSLTITNGGKGPPYHLKPSVYGGVFMTVGNGTVFFQPELVYSRQGALFKWNDDRVFYGIDYINIPLLFRGGNRYVTFDLGPQVGFALGARKLHKNETERESIRTKEGLRTVDMAVCVGGTVRLYRGLDFSARFNIGVFAASRYHLHLVGRRQIGDLVYWERNIGAYSRNNPPNRINMVIQLGFGYTFGYGKGTE